MLNDHFQMEQIQRNQIHAVFIYNFIHQHIFGRKYTTNISLLEFFLNHVLETVVILLWEMNFISTTATKTISANDNGK